jgi:hypothetical protein
MSRISRAAARTEIKQKLRDRPIGIGHNCRPPLLDLPNDSHVMTFAQWCEVASIGQRTGRRILASGTGPTVTNLSDRRIGITFRHHREWLARRAR